MVDFPVNLLGKVKISADCFTKEKTTTMGLYSNNCFGYTRAHVIRKKDDKKYERVHLKQTVKMPPKTKLLAIEPKSQQNG